MSRFTPNELQASLAGRLLCFPVTHSTPDLQFDQKRYQDHLSLLGSFGPGAMTAPGGTGEFFSLTRAEVSRVTRAAVAVRPANTAVLGAAGYGTATAVEMAQDAEAAGADGLFLLPPYLTDVDQKGLVNHVRTVCRSTTLGVLLYHRGEARFSAASIAELAETCPNLIAFKDGIGDLDLLTELSLTVGDRLIYVDGLPTAEINAASYVAGGASTYSSAIFNFMPEWAMAFHAAVLGGNSQHVREGLRDFVVPFLDIRDRRKGYGVAIVKAGMTAVGRSAGPVRPPLVDLLPDELDELVALVESVSQPTHALTS
jgi:5-dehydro-4-deoxyglucarate dehydratase